ncbi:protein kinase [Motilibacter sp. K478]|nr:protein kinase [Motilibacter aurantiacus]NHC47139.1 protein kinase [Motilibacter aurantiacus]
MVVATSEYEDERLGKLRAPARDATEFAAALAHPEIGDFQVNSIVNEPRQVIEESIEHFFAGRTPEDLLVVHFSGHGLKNQYGRLYLAAKNTNLDRLASTSVSASFIEERLSETRSRKVVVLLDCCYSGAFARGFVPKGTDSVDVLQQFSGRGRVVITASTAMEYAFEEADLSIEAGSPSIFTGALVRGLETGEADIDQDGHVSVDDLYQYTFSAVREQTSAQTPTLKIMDLEGSLRIARARQREPLKAFRAALTTQSTDAPRYDTGDVFSSRSAVQVYRGFDRVLQRKVLIVLPNEKAPGELARAAMKRAGVAAAKVRHSAVLTVHDAALDARPPYLVLEYVDAVAASDLLSNSSSGLPEFLVADLGEQVCRGLQAIHDAGIVHRNIKPLNILWTREGRVKIFGFDLALSDADVKSPGGVVGTAGYLSPEQARGEPVDGRSDIYSLGCALYELRSGRPPFTGTSPVSVAYQHVREEPARLGVLMTGVSEAFDLCIMRALRKKPDDRFQSADEMAEGLVKCAEMEN